MKRLFGVLSLVFGVALIVFFTRDVDTLRGATNFHTGNYEQAYGPLRYAAKKGHTESQYLLGQLYEHGWVVKRDTVQAKLWYRRAAEKQDYWSGGARRALGDLSLKDGDYQEAVKWFERSVEKRDKAAMRQLSFLLSKGLGTPKDGRRALELYVESIENPISKEQLPEGWLLLTPMRLLDGGEGVIDDLTRRARSGDPAAAYDLGRLTGPLAEAFGLSAEGSAFNWISDAADRGLPQAQVALGDLYLMGTSEMSRDPALAAMWYRRAADQEYPSGQVKLGDLLKKGTGVDKDGQQAFELYDRAASAGDPIGLMRRGEMMIDSGDAEYIEAAKSDLQQSVVRGYPNKWELRAQLNAIEYVALRKVRAPYSEVSAAEERVLKRMRDLYSAAAESGPVNAANFGALLYWGYRGYDDEETAFYWLRKAAQGGEPRAHFLLAASSISKYSPSPNAEAYRWALLSAAHGYKPAADFVLRLRAVMTPETIGAGRKSAVECLRTAYKVC